MKPLALFTTLCLCLLATGPANAQTKQQTYLHLTDAAGKTITGSSTQRFYEKQIVVGNFSGVTTGSPQIQFSMPVSGAGAALANLQYGKQKLSYGVFSIVQVWESGPVLTYTVRLEDITVLKVQEAASGTTVTLQASRIGTTHYQYDRKKGSITVSAKSGYDFINNSSWNNF